MYCHCVKWVTILHMFKGDKLFGPCKWYLRKHINRVPTSCCWMFKGGGTEKVSEALIRFTWMLILPLDLCYIQFHTVLFHWHQKLWVICVHIRIIQMDNGGNHFPIFLSVVWLQHFCCWVAMLCNFKLVFYCNVI